MSTRQFLPEPYGAGILCPGCGAADDTAVRDSRNVDGAVRRRRLCKGCGTRFSTYEFVSREGIAELQRRLRARERLEALTVSQRHLVDALIEEFERERLHGFRGVDNDGSVCKPEVVSEAKNSFSQ